MGEEAKENVGAVQCCGCSWTVSDSVCTVVDLFSLFLFSGLLPNSDRLVPAWISAAVLFPRDTLRTSLDSEGRIARLQQHSEGTLKTWPSLHCSSSALWLIDPCPLTPPRKKREEGPLVHSKRFARPFGDPDTTALGLQYLQQGRRKKKEKNRLDWRSLG